MSHSYEDNAYIKSITEEVGNKAEKLSRNNMKNQTIATKSR